MENVYWTTNRRYVTITTERYRKKNSSYSRGKERCKWKKRAKLRSWIEKTLTWHHLRWRCEILSAKQNGEIHSIACEYESTRFNYPISYFFFFRKIKHPSHLFRWQRAKFVQFSLQLDKSHFFCFSISPKNKLEIENFHFDNVPFGIAGICFSVFIFIFLQYASFPSKCLKTPSMHAQYACK